MKSKKQKYEEAVERNLTYRLKAQSEAVPVAADKSSRYTNEELVKMGLDGLKKKVGLRLKDDSRNAPLSALITTAEKSLAKDSAAKKKSKEKAVEEAKAQKPQSAEADPNSSLDSPPPLLSRLFGKSKKKGASPK